MPGRMAWRVGIRYPCGEECLADGRADSTRSTVADLASSIPAAGTKAVYDPTTGQGVGLAYRGPANKGAWGRSANLTRSLKGRRDYFDFHINVR